MADHEFPAARWRIIDDVAHPVHLGLAIDEVLARTQGGKCNVVRFYQFAPPCVVLGANQDAREVDLAYIQGANLELGRRITGGGAIIKGLPDKDSQLGISIIYTHDPSFPLKLGSKYYNLSRPIVHALRMMGIRAEYKENSDIVVDGRKIAGQAIYTEENFTFLHSTVLFDYELSVMLRVARINPDPANLELYSRKFTTILEQTGMAPSDALPSFKEAFLEQCCRQFNATCEYRPLTPDELAAARRLQREKHSQPGYVFDLDGTTMGNCFL